MIVTLTPNPSIDRTVSISHLERGEVHRATASRVDPGGKGVNVSRALAAHGLHSVAVLPAGGAEGALLERLLTSTGVEVLPVPIGGSVRANVALVEPDGTTTKVNEPGPTLTTAELSSLVAGAATALMRGPSWVVGCGSLPPGVDDELYAVLVRRARAAGVRVAVDTSGVPLARAVAAGPDLIKPNHEELAELVGTALPTLADVHTAAKGLLGQGVGTVVVSLGRHGALLVTDGLTAHGHAVVDRPLSTDGAGDALLAGYLHATATGSAPDSALAAGVAWGAAAVGLPGSRMPTPGDVHGIPVLVTHHPDLTLRLAP
ncbi:MAG: 1-phosphofructokinase [Oryzihumus sp.]